MILHLAAATHHISTGRILNTVTCTACYLHRLQNMDIFSRHLCVSHKKTRRRQRSQSTSDDISRFALDSRRFLRARKRLIISLRIINSLAVFLLAAAFRIPVIRSRLSHFSCLFPLRRRCRQPRSNCQCRYRTRFPCFLIHVLIAPAFLQLSNHFFFTLPRYLVFNTI